jgi:hypothetical protein
METHKDNDRAALGGCSSAAPCSATVGGWWVFRLDKHDHAKIGDYWAGPFLNKYQADEWMKKQTWPQPLIVGRPAIICDESPNDQARGSVAGGESEVRHLVCYRCCGTGRVWGVVTNQVNECLSCGGTGRIRITKPPNDQALPQGGAKKGNDEH